MKAFIISRAFSANIEAYAVEMDLLCVKCYRRSFLANLSLKVPLSSIG